MKSSRRKFLKVAGVAALGMGIQSALGGAANAADPLDDSRYTAASIATKAKHWGMVIDTAAFQSHADFQKVIDACHKYHNVPEIPDKKEIKWIWFDDFHHTFTEKENNYMAEEVHNRKFLLLCNQCENPPCVRVCPTKATFQREDGIVEMDMHRCIGCRFCMAACPFGARSFNFYDPRRFMKEENPEYPTRRHGVVEKCNFCAERLDKGQMPRCVEESDGAMVFGDLGDPDSEIRHLLHEHFTIRRKPSLGTSPSVYYII